MFVLSQSVLADKQALQNKSFSEIQFSRRLLIVDMWIMGGLELCQLRIDNIVISHRRQGHQRHGESYHSILFLHCRIVVAHSVNNFATCILSPGIALTVLSKNV